MRTLGIIFALIVSPALLPIVIVVAMERRAEPLDPPSGRPTALFWADRFFVSKGQFASWLEDRGVTYQEWVSRHPGASPWGRRAASPVRPAKPAAAGREAASGDRRATEQPPAGDRLRSSLGRAWGAL